MRTFLKTRLPWLVVILLAGLMITGGSSVTEAKAAPPVFEMVGDYGDFGGCDYDKQHNQESVKFIASGAVSQ